MNYATACIATIFFGAVTPVIAAEITPANPETEQHTQIALDQNSIAILPIKVLTDDPRGPGLAVEAYEELLNQLTTVGRLRVVEQGRVEPFGSTELPAFEIARELGVGNILQGDIQLRPPYYVLRLQFINAQTDRSHFGMSALIGVTDPTIKCAINPETALPDGISDVVSSVQQWLFPVAEPDRQQQVAIARSVFLNTNLSDKERMLGLRELKPARYAGYPPRYVEGGAEVFSGAVAVAAAQLALESKDSGIRHGIWLTMGGVGDLYLVEPLLQSLKNDDDVWVRAQAAMTLVDFLNEAGVRDALDYARVNDPEKMVRKAANFSMLSKSERQENLKATLLDPSESDWDRWTAIGALQRDYRDAEPFDEEFMLTAIALAKSSRDPRVRRGIWRNMGNTGDPMVVGPLLLALRDDRDERVRESVVYALGLRFIEEPGVREAVEGARDGDPSPLVRKKAEQVLHIDMRRRMTAPGRLQ